MRVGVLGTTEVVVDGAPVDLGPLRQRAVLAALALHAGDGVLPATLADLVWEGRPPPTADGTLQAYVARLRRALEPDRAPRQPAEVLVRTAAGYALAADRVTVDAGELVAAVADVRRHLAGVPAHAAPGTVDDALVARLVDDLDTALASWRGTPYADLGDAPAVVAGRARLEDLALVAREDRAALELLRGHHALVAADLEPLVAAHPLRERLWELRAVALVRSGRQGEALELLRRAREVLVEELGLDPGPSLRALQDLVLRQDPGLTAPAVPGVPARAQAAVVVPAPAAWPLVGRADELGVATAALDEAIAGRPRSVVVTGEPGIGKSRLLGELTAHARGRGAAVLEGRCSQDEGAPPLHPWSSVLAGLGASLPTLVGEEHPGTQFRAFEEIVRVVRDAARHQPVVVALEDLHWADTSTLRVLRLLTEAVGSDRLLVVATWRDRPAPEGALAEVSEALARRAADRVRLDGLADDAVDRLVSTVAGRPAGGRAAALRARTEGNPFFLVELARLARDGVDLDDLVAGGDAPAAVQDVLARRLAGLPGPTVAVLRAAALVGREVDLDALAVACAQDHDDLLDELDRAVGSGLLEEVGTDRWRFSHALVRDAVGRTLPRSRAARLHLRLAEALERRSGREGEAARHWAAAGASYAGRAWRACLPAATAAHRVFAHDEAVELTATALAAVADDPDADLRDRLHVREQHAEALRRAGRWTELREQVRALVREGSGLPDPEGLERLVDAVTLSIDGALWQTSEQGHVDEGLVGALRSALRRLPEGDSPARCRVMVALVDEVYYVAPAHERDALTEEALAMARRLGDDRLLLWCCLTVATSCWRAGNAEQRHALLEEALALALALGEPVSRSSATTLLAAVSQELGRIGEMEQWVAEGLRLARDLRHRYAEMVLLALDLPWAAMRGEDDRLARGLVEIERVVGSLSLAMGSDAVLSVVGVQLVWSGREGEFARLLGGLEGGAALPFQTVVSAMLCRAGELDAARAHLRDHPADLDHDGWYSPLVWAMAAESAAALGMSDLAARSYALLSPLAGRPASTGSAVAMGPVDAWLALAAAAVGQSDLAADHARETRRLCEEWRVPRVRSWFDRALAGVDRPG